MRYENPNPAAFRSTNWGIDLSRVVIIVRDPRDNAARVLIDGMTSNDVRDWILIPCDRERFNELLDAFETYHSKA